MRVGANKTEFPEVFNHSKADEIVAALGSDALSPFDRSLVCTVAGNSPYLASLMLRYPQQTLDFLREDPAASYGILCEELNSERDATETDEEFMAFLRERKNLVALLIAMADVSENWSLEEVTAQLSEFANTCLGLAIARALRKRMVAGDLPWPNGTGPSTPISMSANTSCGYFILGLGKLGAGELNYSSDIDLVALYDPEKINYIGRKSLSDCCVKITQDVVRFIDQRTMHGYVFRVDLRLRPDPGATPVAISVDAALGYYHSIAANWERSAMIKAAFSAGDLDAAQNYLDELSSWIWRRNIDFEALNDIAAIKNQINRHYDVEDAQFAGFDVKLGHGGIREIEFYAQINQLLHGGRNPSLRLKGTVATLEMLRSLDLIPPDTYQDLVFAYRFLRTIEHRIQMTNDEQTHSIPNDMQELGRLTAFAGYANQEDFEQKLLEHTEKVKAHYDALLPDRDGDAIAMTENQLRALLERCGFQNVNSAGELIGAWKYGRYRSLKTNRARGLLAECLPKLITAFSKAHSPDAALARFDTFLAQLPAGVQLFSLLQANPSLLALLARIIALAPALSTILAKAPGLWDAVLDSQFFESPKDKAELRQDLRTMLSTARDYQDVLDFARRFAAEQKFRYGVLLLEGIASSEEIGQALSDVADVVLQELIPIVESDFEAKHGQFSGTEQGMVVVALGKYGGRELNHTSDLDIVFLYPAVSDGEFSKGKKPLSANVYYTRLAQHIITAITALTPEGRLFDVDTRLRPSGNQGPLAVSLTSFSEYYREGAWTWEFMALTRARVVCAPKSFGEKVEQSITSAIACGRQDATLAKDVIEMRGKLADQFKTNNIWETKHVRGGLVDIEFICQYLALMNARQVIGKPIANTPACLDTLHKLGLLETPDYQVLASGYDLQRTVQSLLRLCLETTPNHADQIPSGLAQVLFDSGSYPSLEALQEGLKDSQRDCFAIHRKIIQLQHS